MTFTNYFTTLTALDESYGDVIQNILNTQFKIKPTKYLIVNEHGSSGKNSHYHIYFNNSQFTRGTEYNRYFKPLYKEFKNFNKKSIVTKEITSDLNTFLSFYFFKEGITLDDIKYKGFSEETIQQIFKNRILKKIKKRKIHLDDAPEVFLQTIKDLEIHDKEIYCNMSKELKSSIFRLCMKELSRHNIVHHLYKWEMEICKGIYDLDCATMYDDEESIKIISVVKINKKSLIQ